MISDPVGVVVVLATILLVSCPHQIQLATCVDHCATDLINRACDGTIYKSVCRSTLLGFGSNAADGTPRDLHDLLELTLKAAAANVSKTMYVRIDELITSNADDDFMEQCLSDCLDNYEDVMDQLDDSMAALDARGYDDIHAWLESAVNDVESCEEGFREKRGYRSPLSETNRIFNQLLSIALAINKMLADEH